MWKDFEQSWLSIYRQVLEVQHSFQLPNRNVYSFVFQEVNLSFSEQNQNILGKLRSDWNYYII